MDDRGIWGHFAERFAKMPVLLRVFVVLGTMAGLITGFVIAGQVLPEGIRLSRFVLGWIAGLGCAGFFVGLVVGCLVELIVQGARKKKKKKKKRRRESFEQDEES